MKATILKEGDRVRLVTSRWNDTPLNPVWGGNHGKVLGTVEKTPVKAGATEWFDVRWDSGPVNSYRLEDIALNEIDLHQANSEDVKQEVPKDLEF